MSHVHLKTEQKGIRTGILKQNLNIYSLPYSKEQVGFYVKWDEEWRNSYVASFWTEGLGLDRFKLKITA